MYKNIIDLSGRINELIVKASLYKLVWAGQGGGDCHYRVTDKSNQLTLLYLIVHACTTCHQFYFLFIYPVVPLLMHDLNQICIIFIPIKEDHKV